jgi:glutamate-5-semialdehyde dehydrogenase
MNNPCSEYILNLCRHARQAVQPLALATTTQKNAALQALAVALQKRSDEILSANAGDIQLASQSGLTPALVERLTLNPKRLDEMVAGLLEVAELPDPVGAAYEAQTLPNGLRLSKMRVPIGVIAVIYESRPNVTIETAGLALKTGNALVLRGGKETIATNQALVAAIQQGLGEVGLPQTAVQFVERPERECITELLRMHEFVDMLIPRGGNALHQFCRQNSTIPVITGGIGICHLFVDETADLDAALEVIRNAKIQRPTVCNALDTVLVHEKIAGTFLVRLVERLLPDGVSFRAAGNALPFLVDYTQSGVLPAGLQDFDTEWLSLVLGLKVVSGLDEAISHIQEHSTQHSDGILTANRANARRFIASVDSAAVYVNASTRFTDGGQFGLGGEVAVSTQRLHARGPMGLEALTSYKWVIEGDYHVRG